MDRRALRNTRREIPDIDGLDLQLRIGLPGNRG
jgi:hypothetical protein